MKTFTVIVAVALVLTFICVQESSAVPAAEGPGQVEVPTDDSLLGLDQDIPEESWNTPYNSVQMRHRRRYCHFCCLCCGCCSNMLGCEECCK